MRSKTAMAAMAAMGAWILAAAPMARAEDHQFTGNVRHLDATAKTLVVKEHGAKPGKEMTFSLAPDAKIMEGARAKGFQDLKLGEQVKVSYADQDNEHRAQRIEVLPAKTAKAMPPSRPKATP